MLGKLIPKLTRTLAYTVLFGTAFILTGWRYFSPYLPKLEPNQLFGIFIGMTGVIALDIYKLLSSLRLHSIVYIEDGSISEGIRLMIGTNKSIGHLRVWGSTTEVILPNIRDSKAIFNRCEVLVQDHCHIQDLDKQNLIRHKVDSAISTWGDLVKQGIIKKLEIKRFAFTPSQYVVIMDDRAALAGLFVPAGLKAHTVDFITPVTVDSSTERGRELIKKYIYQFDSLFESISESSIITSKRKALRV